jgi:hypothetical protein
MFNKVEKDRFLQEFYFIGLGFKGGPAGIVLLLTPEYPMKYKALRAGFFLFVNGSERWRRRS